MVNNDNQQEYLKSEVSLTSGSPKSEIRNQMSAISFCFHSDFRPLTADLGLSFFRPRPFRFLCFLLLMPLFLTSAGCSKKETKPEVRLVNVQVQQAEKRTLKPYIEAIGTLVAYEEVTVSAEIEGMVKAVKVREGSPVSTGMVLAQIDDTDYKLEQRRAQAAVRQAEATLANTALEYARKKSLLKEELVTRQQFEDVETRLALAEAEVERSRAALALAKQKFGKTNIVSPMACVVKEKKISAGDFVKNATPLFTIIQCNPLKLHFTVSERDVGKLRKGQEVTLKVDAFPGRGFTGKVSIIYPSLDDRTRTLKVEALVPNNDELLKPGLFSKVTLFTDAPKETVVVPITALLYEAEKVRVFTIETDTAREKPVKIGSKYGEYMEIVAGLKDGEQVVVAGQQNLSDGAKVRIVQPEIKTEPRK